MAMNFLGLGFSFGGRDKGMSKTIENQTKHLGLMGQAVKKLDSILSINRLQTFLSAISLSRLKDIADGVEHISSTGRNLTSTLEETFQSNSRSMAAFGVSVGKTGVELTKFQKETNSAAYETGISIDQMGKAFYGFEPAAKMLTNLGIKGGKDFAKFAEVAGIDAQKFGWHMANLGKQTGMTDEQMGLLIAQATKFGQSTGDLSGTLNSLPDMADMLNARKALGDSPEAIAKFGQQIFGLGDALYDVGISDAGGFAKHLAKTMTDSKKTFKDLFAGVGEDLSGFQQELMVSGLDANKVFGAMEQGPADFMKVLAEQVDQLQKNGGDVGKALEFMRGRMSQTFGEEQTNQIVTALQDPVKRGAIAAIKMETTAQGALGKVVAEGYKDRFTLAEHFERAEQMMVYRFRQIGREETKVFVKQSQQAFKKFGDGLEKVSKEKGPLGMFVRKMSEAHQIGAQAFIPEVLRPMVTLSGSVVKEMGPMLGILGSLGFRFGMLLNPINLLLIAGGALIAWFLALRLQGKSTVEAVQTIGDTISNFVSSLPERISRALDAVIGFFKSFGKKAEKGGPDWKGMASKWVAQISGAFKAAWPTIKEQLLTLATMFMDWASKNGPPMMKWLVSKLVDGYVAARMMLAKALVAGIDFALTELKKVDFNAVVKWLTTTLGRALKVAVETAVPVLSLLADEAVKAVRGLLDVLGDIDLRQVLSSIGDFLVGGIGDIIEGAAPILGKILDALPGLLAQAWTVVINFVKGLPKTLAQFLDKLGAMAKEKLPMILKEVFKFILKLPGLILHAFVELVTALPEILKGLGSLIWSALGFIVDLLISIGTGILAAFDETFPGIGEFINGVVKYFTNLWDQIKYLWNEGKSWILAFWGDLKGWVQKGMDAAASIISGMVNDFTAPFRAIWEWVDKLFLHSISSWISADLDKALDFIKNFGKLAGKAFDLVTAPLNALLPASMQIGGTPETKTAVPAAAKPAPALGAEARDAALVAAVHRPVWYSRYEQVFAQRMDLLIRAVKAGPEKKVDMKPGAKGGPKTEDEANLGLGTYLITDIGGAY